MDAVLAAHVCCRFQAAADARPSSLPENQTPQFIIELYATYTGRLAVGHSGNRTGNRGRDAAPAAVLTTVHKYRATNTVQDDSGNDRLMVTATIQYSAKRCICLYCSLGGWTNENMNVLEKC